MPGSLVRRSLLRARLLIAVLLVASCSSDRRTLTGPSFGESDASAPSVSPDVFAGRDAGGEVQSVFMVGDSITAGSKTPLQDGFRALGLDVRAIDADYGRRITVAGSADRSGMEAVSAAPRSAPC